MSLCLIFLYEDGLIPHYNLYSEFQIYLTCSVSNDPFRVSGITGQISRSWATCMPFSIDTEIVCHFIRRRSERKWNERNYYSFWDFVFSNLLWIITAQESMMFSFPWETKEYRGRAFRLDLIDILATRGRWILSVGTRSNYNRTPLITKWRLLFSLFDVLCCLTPWEFFKCQDSIIKLHWSIISPGIQLAHYCSIIACILCPRH